MSNKKVVSWRELVSEEMEKRRKEGASRNLKDVLTKKFIFVGFAAWVLLLPLALTSSKKALIYLKDKWKKLHRLIYIIAIFGVVHFIWLVKKDLTEPLIYAVIILILLLFRFKYRRI